MKIAYLTMAYLSLLWYRKIFDVLWQDYPHDLKTHIISCQRSSITKKFPLSIKHDMPFRIIQRNVEGLWPSLWALKLWDAIIAAKEAGVDIFILLDEDDVFPPWWTKALVAKLSDSGADAVWGYKNIDAKNGSVMGYGKPVEYDSAIGTLAIRIGHLEKAAKLMHDRYPTGTRKGQNRGGALDCHFKEILHAHFKIVEHDELRGYFRTPWTNTTRRPMEEDIGRDFDYGNMRKVKEYKQSKFIRRLHKERMKG